MPPIAAAFIQRYGWRATDILFGIGAAALLSACAAVARLPPIAADLVVRRPLGRVVRSAEFAMLYVSWLFATTALLVPFVFLPSYARNHGANAVAAASLLSIIGGVGTVSRLGIGVLADRMGTVGLFKTTVFVMGASYTIWLVSPAMDGSSFSRPFSGLAMARGFR